MQRVTFGPGSIRQLADQLEGLTFDSLFLVTGRKSFEQPAILEAVSGLMENVPFARFSDFARNPQLADLELGLSLLKSLKHPLILAIGGGSAIDMAKLIRFFAPYPFTPHDYFVQSKSTGDYDVRLPMAVVPTTSGTGSEATQFATIYIDRIKYSLDTPAILPDVVILDPELTMTLPPRETAESGLDALSQAIESYWNVNATEESKIYAKEAIVLVHGNLEDAVLNPSPENRSAMMRGAHMAGKAINMTRTTAAHAISYPMTAHFDVPHGQAVSLSLPYFLEYNENVSEADVLDPRGAAYVKQTLHEIVDLLGYRTAAEAKVGLIDLMQRIGAKTSLKALGIDQAGWEVIVKNGFNPQRVRNNPRVLTEASLHQLLAQFGG